MSNRKNPRPDPAERASPPQRAKSPIRVVGEVGPKAPERPKPPSTMRVLPLEEERLTPSERKQRFASNLDKLLNLLGLSRKDAAEEMEISYPLLRRLATAGVSRIDDLNKANLEVVAGYFGLPYIEDLWRPELWRLVLKPNGPTEFVKLHRKRLDAERKRRVALLRTAAEDELHLLSAALGYEEAKGPSLPEGCAAKVVAILASSKGKQFQQLIDDYHELISQLDHRDDDDRAVING